MVTRVMVIPVSSLLIPLPRTMAGIVVGLAGGVADRCFQGRRRCRGRGGERDSERGERVVVVRILHTSSVVDDDLLIHLVCPVQRRFSCRTDSSRAELFATSQLHSSFNLRSMTFPTHNTPRQPLIRLISTTRTPKNPLSQKNPIPLSTATKVEPHSRRGRPNLQGPPGARVQGPQDHPRAQGWCSMVESSRVESSPGPSASLLFPVCLSSPTSAVRLHGGKQDVLHTCI